MKSSETMENVFEIKRKPYSNTSAPCHTHKNPHKTRSSLIEKQKSTDYDIKGSQCVDPTVPINP